MHAHSSPTKFHRELREFLVVLCHITVDALGLGPAGPAAPRRLTLASFVRSLTNRVSVPSRFYCPLSTATATASSSHVTTYAEITSSSSLCDTDADDEEAEAYADVERKEERTSRDATHKNFARERGSVLEC